MTGRGRNLATPRSKGWIFVEESRPVVPSGSEPGNWAGIRRDPLGVSEEDNGSRRRGLQVRPTACCRIFLHA